MPEHYTLRAETGHFRVVGGGAGFIANTAAIAAESFKHPLEDSLIVMGAGEISTERPPAPDPAVTEFRRGSSQAPSRKSRPAIPVAPHFKLVFLTIVALTLLAGATQVVMATAWGTPSATGFQSDVFSAMGFAWRAGFGAIIGLLTGKNL